MRRTFLTFFLLLLVWTAATAGNNDAKRAATDKFAKCLNQKGATMYGVFWCTHCKDQKDLFGDSFQYVKYVECVTKDKPRDLIPECKAQGIKHTPTWTFANGDRQEGVLQFTDLAAKTGCTAP